MGGPAKEGRSPPTDIAPFWTLSLFPRLTRRALLRACTARVLRRSAALQAMPRGALRERVASRRPASRVPGQESPAQHSAACWVPMQCCFVGTQSTIQSEYNGSALRTTNTEYAGRHLLWQNASRSMCIVLYGVQSTLRSTQGVFNGT